MEEVEDGIGTGYNTTFLFSRIKKNGCAWLLLVSGADSPVTQLEY